MPKFYSNIQIPYKPIEAKNNFANDNYYALKLDFLNKYITSLPT